MSVDPGHTSATPGQPDRPGAFGDPGNTIKLKADHMSVRHALARLIGQLDPLGLDDEELGSVELVTAEALNNIVEHAYNYDPEGDIALIWTFGATGLLIRIEDGGIPFPRDIPPLAAPACAKNQAHLVPEGGFGWFLIQGLARNIVHRRDAGRNVLTFRMAVGLDSHQG